MRNESPRNRSGFTVIEILSALGILALLCVLLIPFAQETVGKAKAAKCANNIRQVGVGFLAYAGEHNGKFPPYPSAEDIANEDVTKGWPYLVSQYVGFDWKAANPPIFACPSGKVHSDLINKPLGVSRGYAMNLFVANRSDQNSTVMGSGKQTLLVEIWSETTQEMPGTKNLLGSTYLSVSDASKARLAWRHHGRMNVFLKNGSVSQTLPGESGYGADIYWLFYENGTVWRDGKARFE